MTENKGMYCHKAGSVVQMYFFEMTAAVGKAKSDIVRSKIPGILEAAQKDDRFLDVPVPQVKQQQQEKPPSDVARMTKEGLPENPTLELVQFWAKRAIHEISATNQKIPLTREMVDLASKSNTFFLPLWSPAGQAIVGAVAHARSTLPPAQWNSGETARLDIAAFIACVFQACGMQTKGQNGIVVMPVRLTSLGDKDISELYAAVLRRLAPEVQRNIILCVKGMPKDSVPGRIVDVIEQMGKFTRACTFETGLLSYPDFSKQFPKLFAAGFDSVDVALGDQEQVFHMPKYAAYYKKAGVKTFVTEVSSKHVFASAIKEGFVYISGSFIRPAQKAAFAVQKLATSDIAGA
jgi:hypothetical protein